LSCDIFPTGEEIWIRRDIPCRGGSSIKRELLLAFYSIYVLGIVPLIIYFIVQIIQNTFFSSQSNTLFFVTPIILIGLSIIIWIPLLILMYPRWLKFLKCSQYCPLWFYAEQLSPVQLTIYHLHKPPSFFALRGSKIRKDIHVLRYFTTLQMADEHSAESTTLGLLTPEEYDRFMQYWNAANPPASTKDQE